MGTNQLQRVFFVWIFLAGSALFGSDPLDLEEQTDEFVLETKRIEIPGYAYAFNPSIVKWRGHIILCFRDIPDPKQSFTSNLGLIWLNENFSPVSEPQILDLREEIPYIPCRAEDGRLVIFQDRLFLVYSDNREEAISKGGFRLYIAELEFNGSTFSATHIECLSQYEGESRNIREKNWVPFVYENSLLLAYSLNPHKIFYPILGTGACETVACTNQSLDWNWGELRGGTPGLLENGEYLALFHSSIPMLSAHSNGREILHYFMGAYTFSATPPFHLTKISPHPIVGKNFYRGPTYRPYWKSVRVVFPGSYIIDGPHLWVAYGRQDHEVWVAKFDKQKLLDSLVSIQPKESPEPPIFPVDQEPNS